MPGFGAWLAIRGSAGVCVQPPWQTLTAQEFSSLTRSAAKNSSSPALGHQQNWWVAMGLPRGLELTLSLE